MRSTADTAAPSQSNASLGIQVPQYFHGLSGTNRDDQSKIEIKH
jgi:hypothetical protein